MVAIWQLLQLDDEVDKFVVMLGEFVYSFLESPPQQGAVWPPGILLIRKICNDWGYSVLRYHRHRRGGTLKQFFKCGKHVGGWWVVIFCLRRKERVVLICGRHSVYSRYSYFRFKSFVIGEIYSGRVVRQLICVVFLVVL
jgi:hypothetical protein